MKKLFYYFKYILNVDRENFVSKKLINYLNSLNYIDKNFFLMKLYNLDKKTYNK